MSMKKFIFPILLAGFGLTLALRLSARASSEKPVSTSGPYDAIDAYVEDQMHRLNIPGISLAIIEGDQIVHLRGFGQARPGGELPAPQTPFFIGSLTKSFTALAVMQLVEAGKVELDAPVQRYLPWFRVADPQASAQITVRHLLNQTSSLPLLPAWQLLANFDDRPGATERQARTLATVAIKRPVGSAFEYSNMNYNLLGLIIEVASGESYADYIQNHIYDPLEMRHSFTSKTAAKQDGLAVGHQSWFGIPVPVPDLKIPLGSLPSGQLMSSAEDMSHYLIVYLNQGRYAEAQILSPEGITELFRPAAETIAWDARPAWYGMGWYNEEQGQTKIISHSGMIPDFYGYMALLPEQKKGVVMLVNANHFTGDFTLTEVGAGIAMRLAGIPPVPLRYSAIPWVVRSLLLIPLLQIAGVALTLGLIRRWRQEPAHRPSLGRAWGLYILPSLVLNLLLALMPVYFLANRILGFMLLFAPDLTWIALISGCFAGIWAFLRTGLILQAVWKPLEAQQRLGISSRTTGHQTAGL